MTLSGHIVHSNSQRSRLLLADAVAPRLRLPLFVFFMTVALAVWSAYDRETALVKALLLCCSLVLMMAFRLLWRRNSRVAAGLMTLTTTLFALYALVTIRDDEALIALATPFDRFVENTLNANIIGGILAMLIPFSIAAVQLNSARWRWASGLLLTGQALVLVLSGSRGAWLALMGVAGLLIVWKLIRRMAHPVVMFGTVISLTIVLTLAGLLFVPDLGQSLLNRLPAAGGASRLDLYRNSIILVNDYPLIGAGLGGFMMLYSTYSFLIHVGFSTHAHNLYLDIAIEQGLVGLFCWLWLCGAAFWIFAQAYNAQGNLQPLSVAAAAALAVLLLHGLVDDAVYASNGIVFMLLPFAFVPFVAAPPTRWQWLPLVALVFVLAAMVLTMRGRSLMWGNWAAVQQSQLELGVYSWPEWPIQDQVRRDHDMSAIVNGYEQALELNPNNIAANRRLGQIQLSLGEYAAARDRLANAYALTPWDNATRQLYGEALLTTGDVEEGRQLWQTVNNEQAQLSMVRSFWYGHIGDGERQRLVEESQ